MKLFLMSAIAASFAVSSAVAADLPYRNTVPVAPFVAVPGFTFTGFYIGVNGGYILHGANKNASGATRAGRLHDVDVKNAFVGGGQIGYNFQVGPAVLGLEADINGTGLTTRKAGSNYTARTALPWFGTVRTRLGVVASERLMVYGTGGLAFGSVNSSIIQGAVAYKPAGSTTRMGWTLGGGVEYALTDNVTVKGEYAYVDLSAKKSRFTQSGRPGAVDALVASVQTKFNIVRVGLNYKF